MRLAAHLVLVALFGLAGAGAATAQNLGQFFEDIGRLGQPRREVTQAEWQRIPSNEIACIDSRLLRSRRSIDTLIRRGIGPTDSRVAGLVRECRLDAALPTRSAPAEAPTAAQGTMAATATYAVDDIKLGDHVSIGSPNYLDFTCAPSQHYADFTLCRRQTADRSRRRRILESTSFLHAADGSAVYINQSIEPVVMDDNDARDEIDRLSEQYGKATLLPMQDARGVPSGVIASWGAVSLQLVEPERRSAIASGTDDSPSLLIDSLGNPQRAAQLGLPIFQIGGGAGYVWSANWNARGRGSVRVVAIDASRLPGTTDAAVVAAAPTAPAPEVAKPVDAPPQPAAPPQVQKAAEPAPAPQPKAPAPATEVRVVGPPIELRANAPTQAAATAANSSGSNGLVTFLIGLVVVLLGAVLYLWRKTRSPQTANAAAPAVATVTPTSASPAATVVTTQDGGRMNLPALVPTESPGSIVSSRDIDVSTDTAMTSAAGDGEKRTIP